MSHGFQENVVICLQISIFDLLTTTMLEFVLNGASL